MCITRVEYLGFYDTLKKQLNVRSGSLRPVLKVLKYDTLNYTTPLKDLYRVSYLGNVKELVESTRETLISHPALNEYT